MRTYCQTHTEPSKLPVKSEPLLSSTEQTCVCMRVNMYVSLYTHTHKRTYVQSLDLEKFLYFENLCNDTHQHMYNTHTHTHIDAHTHVMLTSPTDTHTQMHTYMYCSSLLDMYTHT